MKWSAPRILVYRAVQDYLGFNDFVIPNSV
jgi:hypothetical protein